MLVPRLKVFISSVQKEFSQTRFDLKAFLLGDAVLHRFISEVFLFEELPAGDRRADEVYLENVKRCDIYLGILGYDYGSHPQRSPRSAETKCIHCHGTCAAGITAPATYELPPDAIGEAIVNAIAHRDYHSNASVDIYLFADRLEVWNPASLRGTLTFVGLRVDHPSVPCNPLIAESLYLTRYIERVGSGTQTMIDICSEVGLPEPQFEQRSGFFVVTPWRDWLTPTIISQLDLNDRQRQAVLIAKTNKRLNNLDCQKAFSVSKPTASRDLEEMVRKGVLEKIGTTGKGTYYILNRKQLAKGSRGSLSHAKPLTERAKMRRNGL